MNSRLRWRSLTSAWTLPGDEVDAGQQTDRAAVTFIFMLTCEGRMHAGLGRQVGGGRCDGLYAGLLVVGKTVIAIASAPGFFFVETAAACFKISTWR